MIIKKKDRSYTTKKKYVQGKCLLDSLSSTLRNVGSYISQNKDLIAKPMLGAVGNLAVFGLTDVGKKQLSRLINNSVVQALPVADKIVLTKSVTLKIIHSS